MCSCLDSAIGTIFSSTDTVCTLQVLDLNDMIICLSCKASLFIYKESCFLHCILTLQILHQDETPLLYSLVFGEGVVNDATSVVLFNAVQKIHFESLNGWTALRVFGNFLYLFFTSTILGIAVSY